MKQINHRFPKYMDLLRYTTQLPHAVYNLARKLRRASKREYFNSKASVLQVFPTPGLTICESYLMRCSSLWAFNEIKLFLRWR